MSRVRSDKFTNRAATGPCTFTDGLCATDTTGVAIGVTVGYGGIVAVGATFSGDVSIGGTLTYEDVQNVDSTGLITARNGIKIGPPTAIGATFNPQGDLVVAGVVTATTYYGSGANLSNIVSGIALQADGTDVSAGTAATMINFAGASISNVNSGFSTITISAGITTTSQYAQSGIITINLSGGQAHELTLAAGVSTITCTGGTGKGGESQTIIITQPSSGITTVGFSSYFLWPSGSPPDLSRSSASSEIDMISFVIKQETLTGTGVTQLLASAGVDYQ